MSAASASTAIGGAPQTGQGVSSMPPSGTKKRSVATSKPSVDGSASDVPLLPPGRVPRRARDEAANGALIADFVLLSHPKDVSRASHAGEDQLVVQQPHSKHTSAGPGSGEGSPLKHNTRKQALHRDAHIVARRKPSSMLDLTGPLFSRFFLIFIIGAGVGSTLWNWRTRPQISQSTRIISSEVEKLEEFVARTTKWMQVQLQVVDMKIGQEVGDLKRELQKELGSQLFHVATEMSNLKEKVAHTGAMLDAIFRQGGPLTRKEALELVKAAVDKRAAEGKGSALSLDDVRTTARQIVIRELERHSADGIGRVDYALGSAGGRVITHSEGYFLGRAADWWNVVGFLPGTNRRHPVANKVIQPSFGEPGQCLPLKGSDVWVDIALRTAIRPDAITLEHVSKEIAFDVSSAPKEFHLFGWHEPRGQPDRLHNPVTLRSLGEFKYDIEKPNVQTFPLAERDVEGALVNVIRLHVVSNYGSTGHTCIYRIRVHGSDPALSPAPVTAE